MTDTIDTPPMEGLFRMGINHIQVVSIPVSDQERAKSFYVETLGFALKGDAPFGDERRWIEVVPHGATTSLSLVSWFDSMPPGSLQGIVLGCEDIDTTYAELADRGVEFDGPVTEEFWGLYATFKDPDGNGWVLSQPATV